MPSRKKLNELRQQAAERYKPAVIRLLLVAETPPIPRPPDPPRYFYFETVSKHDDLFRGVVKAILKVEPDRAGKARLLDRMRQKGVFLIDLKPDPSDSRPYAYFVPSLVKRCQELKPDRIILIKANVFEESFAALKAAGLPVSNVCVYFPGQGQQIKFAEQFARAIRQRPRRKTTAPSVAEPTSESGNEGHPCDGGPTTSAAGNQPSSVE